MQTCIWELLLPWISDCRVYILIIWWACCWRGQACFCAGNWIAWKGIKEMKNFFWVYLSGFLIDLPKYTTTFL